MNTSQLPASFRSLYRLFLRTSSASVLHHPRASRNLRRRWRPTFDEASKVTQELQNSLPDVSEEWRQGRVKWLKAWHQRMDNSLNLLYTSAHSRGLPHLTTRTLAYMIGNERRRAIANVMSRKEWKPDSVPKPMSGKEISRMEKKQKEEAFKGHALGALEEVVRKAEASGKLVLGRNTVTLGRFRPRQSRR